MTGLPPTDVDELADFPSVTVVPGNVFYRLHAARHQPGYFSSTGAGRFDPPPHTSSEYGTCYLAESMVGAFLETLGRIRPLPESVIEQRVISEVTPVTELQIADLTAQTVIGRYGIDGDLSAGGDYALPQLWGAALRAAGFDGVRYLARHDPAFTERPARPHAAERAIMPALEHRLDSVIGCRPLAEPPAVRRTSARPTKREAKPSHTGLASDGKGGGPEPSVTGRNRRG